MRQASSCWFRTVATCSRRPRLQRQARARRRATTPEPRARHRPTASALGPGRRAGLAGGRGPAYLAAARGARGGRGGLASGRLCVCGLCLDAYEFGLQYCIRSTGMPLPRPCLPPPPPLAGGSEGPDISVSSRFIPPQPQLRLCSRGSAARSHRPLPDAAAFCSSRTRQHGERRANAQHDEPSTVVLEA